MNMDALLQFIDKHKRVYLYGAGIMGALLADALQDRNVTFSGFVVTKRKQGQSRFFGLPLLEVNELKDVAHEDCGFIYALDIRFHAEVTKGLTEAGFKNFFRIPDGFFQELKEAAKKQTVHEILSVLPQPKVNYLEPTSWRRILLIRLDGIGDVVLFTPFIRAIRQAYPKSEITLIVQPMVYNLMEACPYIDRLLVYDWSEYSGAPLLAICKHAREYAQEQGLAGQYDIALNPRWDIDYYGAGALAYFTGASCRVAWSEHVSPHKAKINCGFDEFYTTTLIDKHVCHEVEHNLQFLTQLGVNISY